jgi:hypothetical protein
MALLTGMKHGIRKLILDGDISATDQDALNRWQTGWSPDGEWRCISMGCGRDPKRTKYARQRATKYPKWNQSFLMIRGGYFYPLTVKGTDWQEFLGPELYDVLQNGGGECG